MEHEVGSIVDIPLHELKIFIDLKMFQDPDFFSKIENTRWGVITLVLPRECGTSVMIPAPDSNPLEEQIVDQLANQYFLESNGLLEINNLDQEIQ